MRRVYSIILFIVIASIDNTVLALLPILAPAIRSDLQVSNQAIGLLIGLNLLIVAATSLVWGYRSDQGDRRRLLMAGTLAWTAPVALVPFASSFGLVFALMLLAGVGLGCIATVGYSIISDMVSERRRGLLLGLWGLLQGVGTLAAGLIWAAMAARAGWRAPFGLMAVVGMVCSGLALFAVSPRKGAADEALGGPARADDVDEHRIEVDDLPRVLGKQSMRWLMAQGLIGQFAYGSLTWTVALLTAKLAAQGVEARLASGVAALLWVVLQVGGVMSLFWGWAGDHLRCRNPRARALLAAYGFWIALPCYLALFWAPLPVSRPDAADAFGLVARELTTSAWWWLALLAATLAVAAQSTNAPNWYALVCEVNVPEHRGTAFSFITLANNVGRAAGAYLVGATFDWLQHAWPAPTNYALGLSVFQLFFIPAGLCFWLAARTTPEEAAQVRRALEARAASRVELRI